MCSIFELLVRFSNFSPSSGGSISELFFLPVQGNQPLKRVGVIHLVVNLKLVVFHYVEELNERINHPESMFGLFQKLSFFHLFEQVADRPFAQKKNLGDLGLVCLKVTIATSLYGVHLLPCYKIKGVELSRG